MAISKEHFMGRQGHAGLYIAALCLLLGGAGWLVAAGLEQGSAYFLNVAEAAMIPGERLKAARIFGTVVNDAIRHDGASFELADSADPTTTMPVRYSGPLPDAFRRGAEVIVEGGMQPDGAFRATRLMTKCPSKYRGAGSKRL